ncbi:sensor domain-containing diguanylate cyclase [Azospirillum sp. TSO35-2]|uniref:GGDEF domain-containing protein n=1 Tax=Azospirillum sp. TSO35-2 TaxID=716796 RepID=UPI000D607036|nr:sensor domain-containing diguanylate cyclase [Azospirillum sp. TSO35-2]PWC32879.1 hypothetical protein TSO352_19980 [Azospirillum sp. TSO35-2]
MRGVTERPSRTVFVVAVAIIAVIGLVVRTLWQDYNRTWLQAEALATDTARVVEAQVSRTVHSADIVLQQVITMIEEAGGLGAVRSEPYWQRVRQYAANVDGGESLWVFDRGGDVVLSTTGPFPGTAFNATDRAYFQAALQSQGLFIGPAIQFKVNGAPVVTASRPLRDKDGVVVGGVVVAINAQWLTEFYALMDFGYSPAIAIFRTDGSIVARRPNLESVIGQSDIDGPLFKEHLPRGQAGFYISTSRFDGKRRMAAYRSLAELNLIIYAGVETATVFASWRERSLWFVIDVAVMLALIVLAILWGSRFRLKARRTQRRLLEAEAMTVQMAAELQYARRDPLTQLPNRGLFLEMAASLHQQCRAQGQTIAVLFIDLDGFKSINDREGHKAGDEVLRRTASVLQALTRDHDLIGRFGGDEFTLCVPGPYNILLQTACSIAERVVGQIAGLEPGLGCSVGIALQPQGCDDLGCTLQRADNAMYRAKRAGKGRYALASELDDCATCSVL